MRRIRFSLTVLVLMAGLMLAPLTFYAKADIDDYFPSTETIVTGTIDGGSFPGAIQTSNDIYRTPLEENVASPNADISPDTEELIWGTSVGFGNLLSDDGLNWVGTEGTNSAIQQYTPGSQTVVKGSHISGSFPSCVVSLSNIATGIDTNTEPGVAQIWFVGASIPSGSQTVSCDLDSATTDDIHFVSMSFTASSDTEIVDNGAISPPATTACSGSSSCTLSHIFDMGAFGDSSAYQTTAGTTDEVMGWTQSSDDVGVAYASISEIATQPNYEIEIKYGWETETCVDTRRLTINAWHTTSENILVQLYDSNELNPATRLTITATSDGTTLTYDLSSDEWDSGDPDLRFLGNTESGDSIQTDLLNDLTIISCVPPLDYELEVKFSWSGISTTGIEWRLFIEGLEGSNPEQIDIRIYDSDEIGLSAIVCSITSITETEYDCGILTTDQLDSGNPDIQIVDNNQASDSLQSTLLLDRTRIQRTFNFYRINQVHHWTMTVDLADSYELRVRSLRSDEDMFVQIWDWMASSWNTRITE